MLEQYLLIIVVFFVIKARIQLSKQMMNQKAPQKQLLQISATICNFEWLKNQEVAGDVNDFQWTGESLNSKMNMRAMCVCGCGSSLQEHMFVW